MKTPERQVELVESDQSRPEKPLRVWPGVLLVSLQWLMRFGVPLVFPGAVAFAVLGGAIGGLAVLVWWVFFSRAAWCERLAALGLIVVGFFATSRLLHESIATGAMGMLSPILAIPGLSLALVIWAVACGHLGKGPRRVAMVASILLACGVWTLVRTGGFTGSFENDLKWRWAKTPEERLLAQAKDDRIVPASAVIVPNQAAEWPGFRGTERDAIIRGVRLETDWSRSPPVQMWRRAVGPGWSSFAVAGDLVYTQEQRGEDEIVACYNLKTGEPVWRHCDSARFWESNAGAGPRATPTLSRGRVYSFGATGILNALEAGDGRATWSRNVASDTGTKIPGWGFASSPIVIDDIVIVAASGKLAAYDAANGQPRWIGPAAGGSYSSPHRAMINGVTQVLLMNGHGLTSVSPSDGKLLWKHAWPGVTIVQPALIESGELLISTGSGGSGLGTRRIAVTRQTSGWNVEERWTSAGLKPYFNDLVVHKRYAFGFDGSILACIDLTDGKRQWKDGRYGNGQLMLLADQDALLVLSEKGEVALVGAKPDGFTEVARFQAIAGKTWNHPALVGDVLLVRNSQEMAAFRMHLASR
jgi:outer membrane protein assembly factor BamB